MSDQQTETALPQAARALLRAATNTMDYWDSCGFSECEEGCECVVDGMRAGIASVQRALEQERAQAPAPAVFGGTCPSHGVFDGPRCSACEAR